MRSTFSLIALLALVSLGSAQAATLHVPSQYPTINLAMTAASSGDSIHVDYGTYNESVTVDKPRIEIDGFNGATLDGTGLDTGIFPDGILISAEHVNIVGLTIRNYTIGISVSAGGSRRLASNKITGCSWGIVCGTGNDPNFPVLATLIDGNYVAHCGIGIDVESSQNVTVSGNNVVGNGSGPVNSGAGIEINGSTQCIVDQNLVSFNTFDGISLLFSDTITVTSNCVCANGLNAMGNGIDFALLDTNSIVTNNTVNFNGLDGILMDALSTGNSITYNSAFGNGHLDAEDTSPRHSNTWRHNAFGHADIK